MQTPRYWRTQKQRYNLVGETCIKCGKGIFPPRDTWKCPDCDPETDIRGKMLKEAGKDLPQKERRG